jgi:hypothetical protein
MSTFSRTIWSDQFNTPTVAALRSELAEPAIPLFDQVRAMFQGFDEIVESIRWYGDCWHWTIEYTLEDHHDENDAIGLIIPSPEDLQLAIPMTESFHSSVPTKRMKRTIKDGFELATPPFHTSFGVWSVASNGMIIDLGQLAKLKMKHLLDLEQ